VKPNAHNLLTWSAVALVLVGMALGEIRGGELLLSAIVVVLLFPHQIVDFVKQAVRR
jgi:hypothetical protein